MRRKMAASCIVCFLLGWAAQTGSAQITPPSLVGSWQLTLVPDSLTSPPSIPIPALATFSSDGNAIAIGNSILAGADGVALVPATKKGKKQCPDGNCLSGTPMAVGNWNGGGAVGHVFFKVLSQITNTNGSLFATRTFQAIVTPSSDGSQFTGSYSFQIIDSSGAMIASGSGAITATLIPHEFIP